MIAKRIQRDKATSSFSRLARYVVDARGQIEPESWTRTADYILDNTNDGAKVGGVRVTNCGTDDPAEAAIKVRLTQAQNTRSKSDKSYHLVFSFPAGERPALETLHKIEDALVEAIGMADHQRISAVHTDTDNLHVHVAINKVHPATFRNVEPFYDKQRLMEACERLEVIHGLQRTNHGLNIDHEQEASHDRERDGNQRDDSRTHDHESIHIDYDSITSADDARRAAALRQSYLEALAEDGEAESIDLVRDLSGIGVVRDPRAAHELLSGLEGADVDHDETPRHDVLRRLRNGNRGHAGEGRLTGRAGDMHAHAGRVALVAWVRDNAGEGLARSDTWEALHTGLAECGLRIKPRGAGLVIATADGSTHVKASDVERGLSMASLEKRLGPYQPPSEAISKIKPRVTYNAPARHKHADTAGLFTVFQRERNAAIVARRREREQLQRQHAHEREKLRQRFAAKRAAVKASTGALRGAKPTHREKTGLRGARSGGAGSQVIVQLAIKSQYSALAKERDAAMRAMQAKQEQQRRAIALSNPLPVWQDWLAMRASSGETAALTVLRSREKKKERFLGNWIKALDAEAAKTVIYEQMKPRTDKSGTVVYDVADGGRVRDTKRGVQVDAPTDAAAFLGLVLAAERYRGQALAVQGSGAFKSQLASLAGEKGLAVTFADAAMEQQRIDAAHKAAGRDDAGAAAPVERDSLDSYIKSRNEQRAETSSISYHRRWESSDAGEAKYQGRRRFPDGKEAVLLERGGNVLVMPVTSAQAAKASTWRVGSTITTDARGRFVGPAQQPDNTITNSNNNTTRPRGKSR